MSISKRILFEITSRKGAVSLHQSTGRAPRKIMNRLRILLLAPSCNPEGISVPFVSYSHAAALAELHEVTLVIGSPVEQAIRRADGKFRTLEVVRTPLLDRIYAWCFRVIFRSNFASQAVTAFSYPFSLAFELKAWRQLRGKIFAGEFDVVLRILPLIAVLPSPFAFLLRKGPIPFVIGPINGGLPFVQGFSQAEKQKEWISGLRKFYRWCPFARSTYRNAAAIIAASSHTCSEFSVFRDKLFFIPENGVSEELCSDRMREVGGSDKIELIFVGGLIPCKGCDLAIRAAAQLLRKRRARLTILGDGPERPRLESLVKDLGVDHAVLFSGWVAHAEVIDRLRASDVLVFPSVRDFGAGVIFEALATGVVPVVIDFGGPGDIVLPETGYKVSLTNEDDVVEQIEAILTKLVNDRALIQRLQQRAITYARESLTWSAKAQRTTRVLHWVLRRGPKPEFLPPKAQNICAGESC